MKSKITTKQAKPPDLVGVDHTGAFVVRGVGGGSTPHGDFEEGKIGDPHSIEDHSAAKTRAHFSTIEAAKIRERLRNFRAQKSPPKIAWRRVLVTLVSALAWIAFAVSLLIVLNALDKTLR